MLIAIPLLITASALTVAIDDGAPGGLYILVLLLIYDAFKMIAIGPVSMIRLVRVRYREAHEQADSEAPKPQYGSRELVDASV